MTPSESKMLLKLASDLQEQGEKLNTIHAALMEVPPGSPKDAIPLLAEVRGGTTAYKRASWATRLLIWALPTLAGLGMAAGKIASWFGAK